jgi:hypothetical protein
VTTLAQAREKGAAKLRGSRQMSPVRHQSIALVRATLQRVGAATAEELWQETRMNFHQVTHALQWLRRAGEAGPIGLASQRENWARDRGRNRKGSALVWAMAGTPMLPAREDSAPAPRARRRKPDPERVAQTITIGRGFNWNAGRLF